MIECRKCKVKNKKTAKHCKKCGFEFSKNKHVLIILGVGLLVIVLLVVFFSGSATTEEVLEVQNNSNLTILEKNKLEVEESVFDKEKAIEELSLKSNPTTIIEFQNQTINDIDESFCGTSTVNLLEILGKPLYENGWIYDDNGARLEPSGYKFIFGDYMIYSKGRLNEETQFVETYEILIRTNDENKSVIKNIKC